MAAVAALRPVACVAGLNAAVQGLVGIVLGVVALCVCFCVLGSVPQASGNDLAQYLTYYLQDQQCRDYDYGLYSNLTSPMALRVWMALSLFFSVSMFVSSVVLVTAVARHWSDEKLQISLVSWLFINTFTAIDDVIHGYVFGSDFLSAMDSSSQGDSLGPLSLGILTFLTLRCGYLWLLNLCFIVYLFGGARALHNYLNEQVPVMDQQPIDTWPTLDDFGKSKMPAEPTPTAVNPRLAQRLETSPTTVYPDHTAMARWPSLNGQAPQTMREPRSTPVRSNSREARSRTVREYSFKRQEGVDNHGYEEESRYYLQLQNETGSTRDYEEHHQAPKSRRDLRARSMSPEKPRSNDPPPGHYRSTDPWNERPIPPPPAPGYLEENEVHIPPVDYLDVEEQMSPRKSRELSLQEAILDRTLRLKKVPDALKKGLQK